MFNLSAHSTYHFHHTYFVIDNNLEHNRIFGLFQFLKEPHIAGLDVTETINHLSSDMSTLEPGKDIGQGIQLVT